MNLIVYTDGACSGNGRKNSQGGWGYAIYSEEGCEITTGYGGEVDTTNNRMEMTAVLMGIQQAIELQDTEFYTITIYTDSAYIHNCKNQGWYKAWRANGWINSKKQAVLNKELWELLIQYFEDFRFIFKKVKGHSGIEQNELVDELARRGAKEAK